MANKKVEEEVSNAMAMVQAAKNNKGGKVPEDTYSVRLKGTDTKVSGAGNMSYILNLEIIQPDNPALHKKKLRASYTKSPNKNAKFIMERYYEILHELGADLRGGMTHSKILEIFEKLENVAPARFDVKVTDQKDDPRYQNVDVITETIEPVLGEVVDLQAALLAEGQTAEEDPGPTTAAEEDVGDEAGEGEITYADLLKEGWTEDQVREDPDYKHLAPTPKKAVKKAPPAKKVVKKAPPKKTSVKAPPADTAEDGVEAEAATTDEKPKKLF
jgi:hypothetical protein